MHAAGLRYFEQVARDGSIRRAAERLHVASSAVNRQILKLEEELGVPLFERVRQGVYLTEAGTALLRHVRQTFADFERTKSEIESLGGVVTGHVRMVCLESLAARVMPAIVAQLAVTYPRVTLSVIVIQPNEALDELRSGQTDFGVVFVDRRSKEVDIESSLVTAIGAVMRPDHPLARHKSVTLTDCAAYPVLTLPDRWLIDAIMNSEFARSGAGFTTRVISNSIELMRKAIVAGLGIGFFTPIGFIDEIKRRELVHVPLAEPWLADSELGILVPRGRSPSAAATVALEAVRAHLLQLARDLPKTLPLRRTRTPAGRRRRA